MSEMLLPNGPLAGPLAMQFGGARPPGLPYAVRYSEEWELLRRQIYAKAVRLRGHLSYDFRILLTDAQLAALAGRMLWRLIAPLEPEVLIGPGFGATPLLYNIAAAALAQGRTLKVLMVRDKRKDHNQKRWIEGDHAAARGKRAVFVDDFLRHGSAIKLTQRALAGEKLELELVAAAVFYDMWLPLVSRQLSLDGLPVLALYTRHDLGQSRDCYDAKAPQMRGACPEFIAAPRWWRFALNERAQYPKKCAPVIAGGAAYVADDQSTLWKHDLASGDILWSVPGVRQPIKGVVQLLQYAEQSIVYGCYDGTLTRVRENGRILWRRRLDSSIHATPSIDAARDRIFINTEQWNEGRPTGHVQCIAFSTGERLWRRRLGWWPPGSTAYCAETNTVIAPCNDRTLTAFDAESGELRWTAKTKGLVRGRPVIQGGCVYAASEAGQLHCVDLLTGQCRWVVPYGAGLMHQFLTVVNDRIFVMDATWHLFALDTCGGALRWMCRLRSPGCWCPIVYGDYLVVASEGGHLAVISHKSEIKVWEGALPGNCHQPPAVHDGTLVVASTAGLLAYDIHSFYQR